MKADKPSAKSQQTVVVGPPRAGVRAVVSVLVAMHIFAVFLGPWAMQPASELASSCARVFQPYLDVLFLANGYRFFAPEPGPSHLVRYELTLPDGSLRSGEFPNRDEHWPRLLYHRHFMLSEFANTLDNPAADRDRLEKLARGYAEHLAHQTGAKTVKLFLRRHYVPRTSEVRNGTKLSDKALYEERPLTVFSRAPG